jgi:twitching motility protein PilT
MPPLIAFLRQMADVPGVSDIRLKYDIRNTSCQAIVHAGKERIFMPVPAELQTRWTEITHFLVPDHPDELGQKEYEAFFEARGNEGETLVRLRVSLTQNMRGQTLVMRVFPRRIPHPDELGMPPELVRYFVQMDDGLFLFGGPTGSGKTTSIAALVQARAEARSQSVITLEDPVEYIYPGLVNESDFDQRQIGQHTSSFGAGLRAALRMRPDVIVVGEIRDAESAATALLAGMTGHLVVATTHLSYAYQGPQRLAAFIDNENSGMRGAAGLETIASVLRGTVAQRLIKNPDTGRQVALHEILLCNNAIAQKITSGAFKSLQLDIQTGRTMGMQSFRDAVQKHIQKGTLPPTTPLPPE